MNDLSEAYSIYPSADKILELLNNSKNKSIKRTSLKKTPYWNTALSLLIAYKFISIEGTGKQEKLLLTDEGIDHLNKGGFGQSFTSQIATEKKKSFKQHLDDLTGLLKIFVILNAFILFTTQIKNPIVRNPIDLNATGVEFISVSMYLLSLIVLWEIIRTTLREGQFSFKFKTLYFLLCTTTIGVGLLFLNQYDQLLYSVIFTAVLFAIIGFVYWLLLKLFLVFVTKKMHTGYQNGGKTYHTFCLLFQ